MHRLITALFIFLLMLSGCHKKAQLTNGVTQSLPYKGSHWELPPVIAICDEAPYKNDEIRHSISWWEELGFEFLGVVILRDLYEANNEEYFCPEDPIPGLIVIRDANKHIHKSNGGKSYGHAHGMYNEETGSIYGFIIEIREPKERVLEHEIGHALGFVHFEKDRHLMNSVWTRGGWNHVGLSAEQN